MDLKSCNAVMTSGSTIILFAHNSNLGLMNRASRADLLGKALEGSTTDMSQLLSRGHVVVSQGDAHTNSSSALKNLKEIKIIH